MMKKRKRKREKKRFFIGTTPFLPRGLLIVKFLSFFVYAFIWFLYPHPFPSFPTYISTYVPLPVRFHAHKFLAIYLDILMRPTLRLLLSTHFYIFFFSPPFWLFLARELWKGKKGRRNLRCAAIIQWGYMYLLLTPSSSVPFPHVPDVVLSGHWSEWRSGYVIFHLSLSLFM